MSSKVVMFLDNAAKTAHIAPEEQKEALLAHIRADQDREVFEEELSVVDAAIGENVIKSLFNATWSILRLKSEKRYY